MGFNSGFKGLIKITWLIIHKTVAPYRPSFGTVCHHFSHIFTSDYETSQNRPHFLQYVYIAHFEYSHILSITRDGLLRTRMWTVFFNVQRGICRWLVRTGSKILLNGFSSFCSSVSLWVPPPLPHQMHITP